MITHVPCFASLALSPSSAIFRPFATLPQSHREKMVRSSACRTVRLVIAHTPAVGERVAKAATVVNGPANTIVGRREELALSVTLRNS